MVRVTTENGCVFNEPPYTEEEIKELERQSAMFSVRTSGDLGRLLGYQSNPKRKRGRLSNKNRAVMTAVTIITYDCMSLTGVCSAA